MLTWFKTAVDGSFFCDPIHPIGRKKGSKQVMHLGEEDVSRQAAFVINYTC